MTVKSIIVLDGHATKVARHDEASALVPQNAVNTKLYFLELALLGKIIGTVDEISQDHIIIQTISGVGYEVICHASCINEAIAGSKLELYIHTYMRSDQLKLYGFTSKDEKILFRYLIEVDGVGPKIALSILSDLGINEIIKAVEIRNIAIFKKISGVGSKTAEKICIELKGKLPYIDTIEINGIIAAPIADDALEALIQLGYNKDRVKLTLDKIVRNNPDIACDVQMMIKQCLKEIGASVHS